MPEVSVCMPCYNAERHIKECIDSVLSQTFSDFEFVIVDDGSTDKTVNFIKSYSDKRIRLIQNEHDFIRSSNTTIGLAEGKYIALMDSDDIMMPDRLLIQYNYLEHHPHIDLIGGGFERFGSMRGFYNPPVNAGCITMEEMLETNLIANPAAMFRKTALDKIPVPYEEKYKYAQDYKLWMTMLAHGLLLDNIPDILLKYRVSHKQISVINRGLMKKRVDLIKKEYDKTLYHHTVPE